MLPLNQRLIIEQSNFAYSPLQKAFEKKTNKKIGYQEEKQIKATEDKKQPDDKKQLGNNEVFLSK